MDLKVKQFIVCPYCQVKASPARQKAIAADETRYECENAHFFAVKTKSVLAKED